MSEQDEDANFMTRFFLTEIHFLDEINFFLCLFVTISSLHLASQSGCEMCHHKNHITASFDELDVVEKSSKIVSHFTREMNYMNHNKN